MVRAAAAAMTKIDDALEARLSSPGSGWLAQLAQVPSCSLLFVCDKTSAKFTSPLLDDHSGGGGGGSSDSQVDATVICTLEIHSTRKETR